MGGRQWSPDDKKRLGELCQQYIGQDHAVQIIADALGRSPESVRQKAKRMGYRFNPNGKSRLDLADIARLLGRHPTTIRRWVQAENMRSVVPKRHSGACPYAIAPDELWGWMEQPEHWHLWRVEDLTDPDWRSHFAALRAEWMDTNDTARFLGIVPEYVSMLIREAKLAGIISPSNCWVRRSEAEAYRARQGGSFAADVDQLRQRVSRLELVIHGTAQVPTPAPATPRRCRARQNAGASSPKNTRPNSAMEEWR